MSCAVLGAGGVGLSIAADLARHGHDVLLIMRESGLTHYEGHIHVQSPHADQWSVPVRATDRLTEQVDVVWTAVKRPQLDAACNRIDAGALSGTTVISLLNGVDHMPMLRNHFGDRVVAGSVRVEARRKSVGQVLRNSLFTELELAATPARSPALDRICDQLEQAGLGVRLESGENAENTVLWRKLSLLAPLALATAAVRGPMGEVRRDARLHELVQDCAAEVCAVAGALGINLSSHRAARILAAIPDRTRSSLSWDVENGALSETHALADPVLRTGNEHGIPTPATAALLRAVLSPGQ
ncbi:ketopantoate reductase family protein [Streptomyces avermitilis]|uniref:ketopantoate reductase family protein n=1 Tax=Streptomyces avermitilis TaxID=33903 RepID=UPI0038038E3A